MIRSRLAFPTFFPSLLAAAAAACLAISLPSTLAKPNPPPSFNRDIRPILSGKCFQCHGPDPNTREADLRLDRRDDAVKASAGSSSAITPGFPDQSLLVTRVEHADPEERMPPLSTHKNVSETERQLLRQWIREGAEYEQHWAFQPIARPPFPKVDLEDIPAAYRPVNAIDLFVIGKLTEHGLKPQPPADRPTLLRRVTLDLTGLPPTPEQLKRFADESTPLDKAYRKAIDELLGSPGYGEHLAWQWLDAARYADSDGYESDPLRNMWPWRDWVIDAFNRNLPYDEFIVEQLAGDLLDDPSMRQVVATGFNRNHRINNEGGVDPEEWLVEYVCDRAETTATVFMGLTWQCARCHDHKYDPITQRDYYRLFAYFHNVPETGNARGSNAAPYLDVPPLADLENYETLLEKLVPLERELATFSKRKDFAPARERWIAAVKEDETVRKKLPGDLGKKAVKDWDAKSKKQASDYFLKNVHQPAADLRKQMRPLETQAAKFRKTGARVMVMGEMAEPRTTRILERGVFDKPLEEVTAATPDFLPALDDALPRNRLGLARWLTHPAHPLTARVIVNRLWERFFGVGLVKTQEDFGSQGELPSHPELLDYLANWLIEHDWDLKALQREIVLSATYRQRSHADPARFAADPENRLLARGPRYRRPASILRDQALAVSGLLVDRVGGPPVKPYQPAGLWKEIIKGRVTYQRDRGEKLYRRSLYTLWRRAVKPPLMMLLDSNERDTCAVSQKRTNTPLQALLLLNDVTFVEAARGLATRMLHEGGKTDTSRIQHGMMLILGRDPTPKEEGILLAELAKERRHFQANPEAAKAFLAVGDSKAHPGVSPAELAAWSTLSRVLLNLDETLTKE